MDRCLAVRGVAPIPLTASLPPGVVLAATPFLETRAGFVEGGALGTCVGQFLDQGFEAIGHVSQRRGQSKLHGRIMTSTTVGASRACSRRRC